VIVVAVLVIGHGDGGGAPAAGSTASGQASTTGGANSAIGPGVSAPGTPTVTARRVSAAEVEFTWKYANPSTGDIFLWRRVLGTVGPSRGQAHTADLTVRLKKGQTLCIEVEVARADGVASGESTPGCWGN